MILSKLTQSFQLQFQFLTFHILDEMKTCHDTTFPNNLMVKDWWFYLDTEFIGVHSFAMLEKVHCTGLKPIHVNFLILNYLKLY